MYNKLHWLSIAFLSMFLVSCSNNKHIDEVQKAPGNIGLNTDNTSVTNTTVDNSNKIPADITITENKFISNFANMQKTVFLIRDSQSIKAYSISLLNSNIGLNNPLPENSDNLDVFNILNSSGFLRFKTPDINSNNVTLDNLTPNQDSFCYTASNKLKISNDGIIEFEEFENNSSIIKKEINCYFSAKFDANEVKFSLSFNRPIYEWADDSYSSFNVLAKFIQNYGLKLIPDYNIVLTLHQLKQDDLSILTGLAAVTSINIHNAQFTNLPDNAFNGLSSLYNLSITNSSKLETISKNSFNGLNLINLYILDTGIKLIPENSFTQLKKLNYLNIENNLQLTAISENAFYGLNLEELDIQKTSIRSIRSSYFNGLKVTDTLKIVENHDLIEIDAGTFDSLSDLKYLYLYNNGLTSISKDLFKGLIYLKTLDLSGNNFENIPANTFNDLTSLTRLVVPGRIKSISPLTFNPNAKCGVNNTIVIGPQTISIINATCSNSP